jgi:hypothetical protein
MIWYLHVLYLWRRYMSWSVKVRVLRVLRKLQNDRSGPKLVRGS